jgi:hypothetical protein
MTSSDTRGRTPLGRRGGIGENGSTRFHNTSGSRVTTMLRSRDLADEDQVSGVCYTLQDGRASKLRRLGNVKFGEARACVTHM